MSSITTIAGTDVIANSRTVINTNFSNLNTDKIETSTLDTDTSLAANSDAKIATQKAVKAYVDAGGNVNASETTKGIVEEATDAEVTAGTGTGATGAKLFITPAKLATRVTALGIPAAITAVIPNPAFTLYSISNIAATTNTTLKLGRVYIPFAITAASVSIRVGNTVTVDGTYKLVLYSEDGQTKIFEVTTATTSASTTMTTAISPSVLIAAGTYYFGVLPVGTANVELPTYTIASGTEFANVLQIAAQPIYAGTLTVTASTIPATITPTAITYAANTTVAFRLDN